MKRLIFLILIIASFGFASFGQNLDIIKLDSFFSSHALHNLAMGSLTISKGGIIQYQKAIAYSNIDIDKKIPADIYTKYRIGSATKMITAVIIFSL